MLKSVILLVNYSIEHVSTSGDSTLNVRVRIFTVHAAGACARQREKSGFVCSLA